VIDFEAATMMASCFSVFAFLSPSADPVGSGPSTCSGRSPSDLFPIVGCKIARRAGEVLKADGKLKMTGSDGLQGSTSLMREASRVRLRGFHQESCQGMMFVWYRNSPSGNSGAQSLLP
jgi:hypothetical protein